MFTNRIIAGLFGAATLFTVTATYAQAPSAQDKAFMETLSHGNVAEVAAGKLALQKSSDKDVRAVAQTIISEHSKNEEMLLALGKKLNVSLPTTPTAKQKATAKKLAMLSGKSFDKAYLADQIKAHDATIALLRKQMATSKNSVVRDYATQTLGGVLAHTDSLHKAQGTSHNKMMSKMGMKTSMVTPTPGGNAVAMVNAQIRSSSAVQNKSFATPAASGIFNAAPAPAKPGPQPSPAPGLD